MVTLDKWEKRVVLAVISEMQKLPYAKLNSIIGSETIREMGKIAQKLRYEDYCERHNIEYEDMTEDDFIQAWLEENEY